MWIRCVIGLRNGPSTCPPSWQMSHIILSSSSTTMKSSKISFSSARKSSSRSLTSRSSSADPATRKVPEIGFIRTSPDLTLTCRSGLAPIRNRSPVKKQNVQYAPRSRSISRRRTVRARAASQSATTAR